MSKAAKMDPNPHTLPETVIAEVIRRVHSRDQEHARQMLETCVTQLRPAHREQILLSILKLAGRSMEKLRDLIEAANEDYRNIECWHSWPEQNRRQFFKGTSSKNRPPP